MNSIVFLKAIIPAMFGVPASNFSGACVKSVFFISTFFIIDPPNRNGGIFSRRWYFPYSIPTPVGPSILCAENTKKSQSKSFTFVF